MNQYSPWCTYVEHISLYSPLYISAKGRDSTGGCGGEGVPLAGWLQVLSCAHEDHGPAREPDYERK